MDLWNPAIWQPSNLWDFFMTKSQTLRPGQFRDLAREDVFLFQYKCPVDHQPGDPKLRLLNHRSGILIRKSALESDVRRHYAGYDTHKFMARAEQGARSMSTAREWIVHIWAGPYDGEKTEFGDLPPPQPGRDNQIRLDTEENQPWVHPYKMDPSQLDEL